MVAWPAEKNRAVQPYNWLLTRSLRDAGVTVEEFSPRRALGRPDIWHLHWPDAVLTNRNPVRALGHLIGLLLLIWAARLRGTSIVWTVHNLASHERHYPALERVLWRVLPRWVDGYFSLSESGKVATVHRVPALERVRGFVVSLGHFRGVYPDEVSREDARAALGLPLDATVIAFAGQVRPYKGVAHLIRCFRQMPGDSLRLIVAGRPSSDAVAEEIQRASAGDARIHLRLEFIPDVELQRVVRAADLIALPFVEILNSASAMLALSFDRPVLVPAIGALAELQRRVDGGWVRLYEGELTPAHLQDALRSVPSLTGRPNLDAFAWPEIGRLTREAYLAIRADRGAVADRG